MPNQQKPDLPKDDSIHVGSIFSHQQKVGLVELSIGEYNFQMPVNDARKLANLLLDAAAAAEMDEVVWTFFNEVYHNQDEQLVSGTLLQFRKIRNSLYERYDKGITPAQAKAQREYLERQKQKKQK